MSNESRGYSASVRLQLVVDERLIELAQIGPDGMPVYLPGGIFLKKNVAWTKTVPQDENTESDA